MTMIRHNNDNDREYGGYMAIENEWEANVKVVKVEAEELGSMNLHPAYGDFFSFVLVTGGKASYNINSHTVNVKPDDILAFSPRHLVGMETFSRDFEAILCMGRVPLVENILTHVASCKMLGDFFITNDIPYLPSSKELKENAIKETLRLMLTIAESFPDKEYSQEMNVRLLEVLMTLVASKLQAPSRLSATEHTEVIYRHFLALVSKHYHKRHSTSFYADELHITPVYLARIVKRYALKSAKEFILNLLNRDAIQMLRYGSMQVSEIADELGFTDIETFSKFFKSRNGISPTSYRNQDKCLDSCK